MAGFARLKFELVRTLLGALLFVSAAMKWHQMVFDPLLDGSLFGSRWLLLLTLELELGLAIWLCWAISPSRCGGRRWRASRRWRW